MQDDLIERLRERAAKVRGWIASSQRVVDLLQPEMDKFDARTGHDLYTVRMSVDHQSSIRTQTKEAEELEAAITRIAALEADSARLMGLVKEAGEGFSGPTAWLERWATHVGNCHGGALCECGLTLASLESATTLAKIKETPDAD